MQSTRGRWLGIGVRVLATLFLLWLMTIVNRCGPSTQPTNPTVVVNPSPVDSAYLSIQVAPQGATIYVEGQKVGTTPLSLELPPGRHQVRVELDGYQSLEQGIVLGAAENATLRANLEPLHLTEPSTATAIEPEPALRPDLLIRHVKIGLETGAACDYASTQLGTQVVVGNDGSADAGPFVVDASGSQEVVSGGLRSGETVTVWLPGYAHGSETTVLVDAAFEVEESDEDNNGWAQLVPIPTLPPPCTPTAGTEATKAPTHTPNRATPTPVPQPAARVTVREEEVRIPTYPYASFTTQAWNETYSMSYPVLDRGAYDASGPVAADVTYRTLVLENEYLALTFLPDVGGRIYEVFYKPTGHRVTYRNPVLKPSPWGPPEQGWWLAAGGIEWCFPVEEHGYEWGVPWQMETNQSGSAATVTLRDTLATDRPRARVDVRLEADAVSFTTQHLVENPTSAPVEIKYWTNAMLAPGGRNAPSSELRFVLPGTVTAVTVHSRGDESLPGYGERMSWPVAGGRDLSRLGNWNRWLGFFEDPAQGGFIGVYDESYDEGMVRVFPEEVARGAKVFALGWGEQIPAGNWTDDGSSYVELHGGLAPTFDDSVTLQPGGRVQWTETWYPVAGLGGLRYANTTAALNLEVSAGRAQVGVATTRPWSGDLVLLLDGEEIWRAPLAMEPGSSFKKTVALDDSVPQTGGLTLRLLAAGGAIVAEYSADFVSK